MLNVKKPIRPGDLVKPRYWSGIYVLGPEGYRTIAAKDLVLCLAVATSPVSDNVGLLMLLPAGKATWCWSRQDSSWRLA